MTRKTITAADLKKATKLCLPHNARVIFSFTGSGSEVDCKKRLIEVDIAEAFTEDRLYSVLYHELAHLECYDKDIFSIYHNDSLEGEEMYLYMKRMALRVERYVDNLAENNMKNNIPHLNFHRSYDSDEEVMWLNEWVEENYGNYT